MIELKLLTFIFVILYNGYHVSAQSLKPIIKCKMGNSTCEMESFVSAKSDLVDNGGLNIIPNLTPLHVTNETVSFFNLVKATLHEGYYTGINTCSLLYFVTNSSTLVKTTKIQCALVDIRGTYTITTDPTFAQWFGDISGSGNFSFVADDWYYEFVTPTKFIKKEDGQIYNELMFEAGTFVSKVLKKITVAFDNIMFNRKNITAKVVSYINKNWKKLIASNLAIDFVQKVLSYYYSINKSAFLAIPATLFYSDDLEAYFCKN